MFLNLTNHPVHVYVGGRRVRSLPVERTLRIEHREAAVETVDGIEIVDVAFQPAVLPRPQPNTWLIVSQVAALSLANAGILRPDILFPGPNVSDRGRTVGCRGLRRLAEPGG